MGRLKGKVAVITGGAAGIGQAFAERLASDGADVAVADISSCGETRERVERAGARFFSAHCDVTSANDVALFKRGVEQNLGKTSILVNNAGIFPMKAFLDLTFDDWRKIQSINVDSMFLVSQTFVPDMIERKYGRIVNMTSTVNWLKIDRYVHYITTKAAVIGFTRGLANELGAHGITVNAIAPSLVRNATTEASPLEFFRL